MKKSVKTKKAPKAKKKPAKLGLKFYAQSKRLAFRLIEASDAALYCGLFTDAKTMKHVRQPLSSDRAALSFAKVVELTHEKPWTQRITVIHDRKSKSPLGIASIRMTDTAKRIAEVGVLLKPTAQAQRYAIEASTALISAAFRRHTIDGITAQVSIGHKVGERLVKALGYTRGDDIAAAPGKSARSSWSMSRETWADTF